MPTNLPSEYFEAEHKYREAITPAEKVDALEKLIGTIPKHKGTDKLRADYRRKLSQIKMQVHAAKHAGKHESHFHIEREGDVRIAVVGAANTGKSSLVAKVSHASPEISDAPYSTWFPMPGMVMFEGVHVQLIDTPALDREYVEPELIELIRSCDLILILVDLQDDSLQQYSLAMEMLENHRLYPPHITPPSTAVHPVMMPMVVAANKDDGENLDEEFTALRELLEESGWHAFPISVKADRNIAELMRSLIQTLNIIRVYSKPPGKEIDRQKPFVLKHGATVADLALKVHHDFVDKLKSARIWGTGVYNGQHVGRDHLLQEGDVVELHL